jgi:hypothetical protein
MYMVPRERGTLFRSRADRVVESPLVPALAHHPDEDADTDRHCQCKERMPLGLVGNRRQRAPSKPGSEFGRIPPDFRRLVAKCARALAKAVRPSEQCGCNGILAWVEARAPIFSKFFSSDLNRRSISPTSAETARVYLDEPDMKRILLRE